MDDKEMYDLVCGKRFDKLEEHVTNHLPHKIDNMFWKLCALIGTIAGITFAVYKIWG